MAESSAPAQTYPVYRASLQVQFTLLQTQQLSRVTATSSYFAASNAYMAAAAVWCSAQQQTHC
jgi:hypothetical protein